MTDDDYELIATRTCDTLKDSLDAMKEAQEKSQSAVEKKILDLRMITEKTAMRYIPPDKTNIGDTSAPPMSREESLVTDRLNTVLIPPRSI